MKARTTVITALLLAGLAGCATHPVGPDGRPQTLQDAGPPPSDQMAAVRDVLKYRLRDFDSAKIELDRAPRRVVMPTWLEHPGGAGWELCPNVNAKNVYGGYVGYKRVLILWKNGAAVDVFDGDHGDFLCRDMHADRLAVDG